MKEWGSGMERAAAADASTRREAQLVLVVDDDPGVREVFRAALEHGGYAVVAVGNAVSALEVVEQQAVDVVLLDVELPGMDGHELLARLRGDPATESLAVIVVTADGGLDGKLAGLRAGANDYLVKPVSLAELLARVESQIRDRSQWVKRIGDQLAARSWLSRGIAELDPESPLAVLESQIHALVGEVVAVGDLRILRVDELDPAAPVPNQVEVARWTGGHDDDGSSLRLPLRSAGRTVGMLEAGVSGEADVALSTLADLAPQIASVASRQLTASAGVATARRHVRDLAAKGGLHAVFQPIVHLETGAVVGFEGLSRFRDGTRPDVAFAAAERAGIGGELEAAAVSTLLAAARDLPEGCWVSLNLSAASFVELDLNRLLGDADRPVVLEITEHEHVTDYAELRRYIAGSDHVEIAVDDAGAGYASLRHIFELRPDYVKLDRAWVDHIDGDPVRRALVQGIVGFADAFGAVVVGEGIERPVEAETLLQLGVHFGQGYALGYPLPAHEYAGEVRA